MLLLKQTALHSYERKEVASLNGEQWILFLDKKVKGSDFNKIQKVIIKAVYQNKFDVNSNFNKERFITLSKNWIKNHAR